MLYRIYALKDPRSGDVRYVGATKLPLKMRLEFHMGDIYGENQGSPRVRWLRKLASSGTRPLIDELEVLDSGAEKAAEREDAWMKHFRDQGCDLLNVRKGGAGLGRRGVSLSRWALDNLGKMPDVRIARREDRTPATIGRWGRKLGLPRYRGGYPPDPFADSSVPAPVQIWNSIQIVKESLRECGILTEQVWQHWEATFVDWQAFYEEYSDPESKRLAWGCGAFIGRLHKDMERLRDETISAT